MPTYMRVSLNRAHVSFQQLSRLSCHHIITTSQEKISDCYHYTQLPVPVADDDSTPATQYEKGGLTAVPLDAYLGPLR